MLEQLRSGLRSPSAGELKFARLATPRGLDSLSWLLAADGPLAGRAAVNLAHKPFVAVAKIVDLLLEEWAHDRGVDLYAGGQARRLAVGLFREGPRALGAEWGSLVDAFVSLARATQRGGVKETLPSFFARLESARWRARRRGVERVLALLLQTRPYAAALGGTALPDLDPLVPVLVQSTREAYARFGATRVLHDEHVLLTDDRLELVLGQLRQVHPEFRRFAAPVPVREIVRGRSEGHASLQLADVVAGAGRAVARHVLGARSPAGERLEPLVRPLVLPGSLWPDDTW